MSHPEVSVVVPVFNRENLICAALSSVQRQKDVDLEILVVDDGSTDRSAEIVRQLAATDRRIIFLPAPHRGPAAARNLGIAAARGEYLTFLDSDDLCPTGRIRRHVAKLRAHPNVIAVVGALLGFDALDASGEPMPGPIHVPYHNAALHAATFRTDAFRRFGPLDEDLAYAEDVDFFLRLLEAEARLLLEADVASYYRFHGSNMVRDLKAKQRGYVQAYARSIRRRRAAGRTAPLQSFFPKTFDRDVEFGGPPEMS